MCLKVVNVTGKSKGLAGPEVSGGEAGSYRVRVQAMWLPSCLTPAVNSGVLKTACCFGNLLEGHTEPSRKLLCSWLWFITEKGYAWTERGQGRWCIEAGGQESSRRGLLGSTQHHVTSLAALCDHEALGVPALGVHSFYWDSSCRRKWSQTHGPPEVQLTQNPHPESHSCLPWPKVPRARGGTVTTLCKARA